MADASSGVTDDAIAVVAVDDAGVAGTGVVGDVAGERDAVQRRPLLELLREVRVVDERVRLPVQRLHPRVRPLVARVHRPHLLRPLLPRLDVLSIRARRVRAVHMREMTG